MGDKAAPVTSLNRIWILDKTMMQHRMILMKDAEYLISQCSQRG